MCSRWFLTICCWRFLSGFLLFTNLCKIIMEKCLGIKGDGLISWVCAPLHFCIAFWWFIYLALGLSALAVQTPETWCGQREGDLTGIVVICCPWAFLEIKQVLFPPREMAVQVLWLGDIQGLCARVDMCPSCQSYHLFSPQILPLLSLYQLPCYTLLPSSFEKLPLRHWPLISSKFLSL